MKEGLKDTIYIIAVAGCIWAIGLFTEWILPGFLPLKNSHDYFIGIYMKGLCVSLIIFGALFLSILACFAYSKWKYGEPLNKMP